MEETNVINQMGMRYLIEDTFYIRGEKNQDDFTSFVIDKDFLRYYLDVQKFGIVPYGKRLEDEILTDEWDEVYILLFKWVQEFYLNF